MVTSAAAAATAASAAATSRVSRYPRRPASIPPIAGPQTKAANTAPRKPDMPTARFERSECWAT